MTGAPPFVLALSEAGAAGLGQVGRKAGTLGELLAAGFPVQTGFVVTAGALAAALAAAGLSGGATEAQVRSLPLPAEVEQAIAEEYERAAGADGAVAVRSSGIAEDTAERSFAGQYESVLGVVGAAAVAEAVRVCWASAFADRVRRYAATPAEPPNATQSAQSAQPTQSQDSAISAGAPMAVLIQPMVAADAAGIAFTANPVTGAEEVLVSAVRGLGDQLAAGGVTPEEWTVRDGRAVRTSADLQALTTQSASAVAALAEKVADALGAPQDIEWAVEGDHVVLLQARPITTLDRAQQDADSHAGADADPAPEGFWLRGNYSLKPLSPMNVSTALTAVNRYSSELFRYALGTRIEVRPVRGWSYVRFVQSSNTDDLRQKLENAAASLRADEPGRLVRTWRSRWEPAAAARIERMHGMDLSALSDRRLISQLIRRQAFGERLQRLHFLVGGASLIEWAELGVFCERELGWDVARVLGLLVGLPGKTTEPSLALARLVAGVRPFAASSALLSGTPEWDEILTADPDFAAEADAYLLRFGQRVLGADIAEPTLRERPASLLRLIADALATGEDPAREIELAAAGRTEAVAAAARGLAERSPSMSAEFEQLIVRAQDAFPLRDDTAFYGHVAWGLVRYALLEIASRLVRRGALERETDVFLLTLDEVTTALAHGEDLRTLATQRAHQVAEAEHHRGPLTLGTPQGRPIALAEVLPLLGAEDRERLEVVRWADEAYRIGTERVEQEGSVLRGVAASAGRYTGPARILFSEADFGRLRPGDVLVCPETTAQWSVLFSSVGALVTDTGGLLSHPAIIAREYRVPAVLATGNATSILRDGQLVTVDGTTGLVEILDDAAGTLEPMTTPGVSQRQGEGKP